MGQAPGAWRQERENQSDVWGAAGAHTRYGWCFRGLEVLALSPETAPKVPMVWGKVRTPSFRCVL